MNALLKLLDKITGREKLRRLEIEKRHRANLRDQLNRAIAESQAQLVFDLAMTGAKIASFMARLECENQVRHAEMMRDFHRQLAQKI